MTRAAQLAGLGSLEGSAPAYACRAWVNFNGTGTVAIRASGNVSSITDNGTGSYTVNFATAMPDANYAFSGSCINTSNMYGAFVYGQWNDGTGMAKTTTSVKIATVSSGGQTDTYEIYAAIFR